MYTIISGTNREGSHTEKVAGQYQKMFKEKGIEIVDNLRTHPYSLREFAFIDLNGYYIRLAENAEEK